MLTEDRGLTARTSHLPAAADTAVLPFVRLYAFHLLRASFLRAIGRYSESLADALEALGLASQDPLKQVSALNMSGQARHNLNDLRGAKSDFETALVLAVSNLKEESPEILSLQNNLAATLADLGDFDHAKRLNQQNVKVRERMLGSEHPETLTARNNLAYTLQRLADFEAAGKLHQQNLEILERVLGNDDPRTLQSKHNLAASYGELGDLGSAKRLHEETLAIRERVLGREHPDTLESMQSLGCTLRDLGDLPGARKLLQQAMQINGRVLGSKHPYTTMSTWSLLRTVRQLNDPDAEAQLIDKLRWLLELDEASIPSADHREIRRMLFDLLNPF